MESAFGVDHGEIEKRAPMGALKTPGMSTFNSRVAASSTRKNLPGKPTGMLRQRVGAANVRQKAGQGMSTFRSRIGA